MSEVLVRPATVEDLPAILAIEQASFTDPWTLGAFRSMLGQSHVMAAVAELDGEVAGYSVAWAIGDEAELANLAVAPGRRGQGIGRRLLDALLRMVDGQGGANVFLEVRDSNEAAQALYRSRGFTAAGRRKGYYRKPTEDAVVMRRPRAGPSGDD